MVINLEELLYNDFGCHAEFISASFCQFILLSEYYFMKDPETSSG